MREKNENEERQNDVMEQILLLIKDATYFSGFELEGDNPYYGMQKVLERIYVLASKMDLSKSDRRKIRAAINLTIEILNDEYKEQYNEVEGIIPLITYKLRAESHH